MLFALDPRYIINITNRLTLLIASTRDTLLLLSLAKKFEHGIAIRLYHG
jgi:hypothetical protein